MLIQLELGRRRSSIGTGHPSLDHCIHEIGMRKREFFVSVFVLIIVEVLALVNNFEVIVCPQLLPDVRYSGMLVDIGIEAMISHAF